jgi:hypothetical protein
MRWVGHYHAALPPGGGAGAEQRFLSLGVQVIA